MPHDNDEDPATDIVVTGPKVSRAEAAKMLGVSKMTIRRLESRGKIVPCEISPEGHRFFARSDIENLKPEETDEEQEKPPSDGQAIIAASVELVRVGLENAKRSAELYFAPSERAFQQVLTLNEKLMARNELLESRLLEQTEAMQAVLNEQHVRESATRDQQAKIQNRQTMLKEAMKTFPWIAVAVAEKFGLSPVSQKLMHFLQVLDRDKLQLMLESDMVLSDVEKAALQDLLKSAGVDNINKIAAELPETASPETTSDVA